MPAKKSEKIIHALGTPYLSPSWPEISRDVEQSIVELLSPHLDSLAQTRKPRSSRNRKRKRGKSATLKKDDIRQEDAAPAVETPFTVGFNATVRRLENMAHGKAAKVKDGKPALVSTRPLCAVFVAHLTLPPILTATLPALAVMASIARSEAPPVRLIPLREASIAKLANRLKQPRLGLLGLESDSSSTKGLERLIVETIAPVDEPWIRQATIPHYLPVKIQSQDATSTSGRESKTLQQEKVK